MAGLNVTYEEMDNAAKKLTSAQTEIEGTLGQLKRMIETLVSEGFVTDSASVQFDTSYEEFNDGVTKTVAGLEGMSNYLTTAAETLQQTDVELGNALKAV